MFKRQHQIKPDHPLPKKEKENLIRADEFEIYGKSLLEQAWWQLKKKWENERKKSRRER